MSTNNNVIVNHNEGAPCFYRRSTSIAKQVR